MWCFVMSYVCVESSKRPVCPVDRMRNVVRIGSDVDGGVGPRRLLPAAGSARGAFLLSPPMGSGSFIRCDPVRSGRAMISPRSGGSKHNSAVVMGARQKLYSQRWRATRGSWCWLVARLRWHPCRGVNPGLARFVVAEDSWKHALLCNVRNELGQGNVSRSGGIEE